MLYELLKTGETGKLKEDVRSLRRVVQKFEGALRGNSRRSNTQVPVNLIPLLNTESHQVIASLSYVESVPRIIPSLTCTASEELEKSRATVLANGRPNNYNDARGPSQSPVLRTNHQLPPHPNANGGGGGGKPPPTGPRAHKKPRLAETQSSVTPIPQHVKGNRSQSKTNRRHDTPERPERSPRVISNERRGKMEVDEDDRPQARTPERDRDFDREREKERNIDRDRNRDRPRDKERDRHRERDRDRDRDRPREHDRNTKRNGAYGGPPGGGGGAAGGGSGGGGGGGGGGRRPRRGSNSNSYASADRTLAERMGL